MTTIGNWVGRYLLTAACLVITATACKKSANGPDIDKTPSKVTPRSTSHGSAGPSG